MAWVFFVMSVQEWDNGSEKSLSILQACVNNPPEAIVIDGRRPAWSRGVRVMGGIANMGYDYEKESRSLSNDSI